MKILYISTNITDSGGVSRVVSQKANYFADDLGYEVHIYSTNDRQITPFYFFSESIKFHYSKHQSFGIKNLLNYKKEIQNLSNEIRPDIIFVVDNGLKSLLIFNDLYSHSQRIYELHSSKPLFLHRTYSGLKKICYQLAIRTQLPKFDKIILLKEEYQMEFIPFQKQMVIPNPLPFSSDETSHLQNKKGIAVGRIAKVKGYERMLLAWREVVNIHPEYILDIYGDAMEGFSLDSLITKLNLENNVKVFPSTPAIKDKYLKADFLLHTAYFEPFGLVFIEAMECGLPVIGYATESNKLTIHNHNALVANNNKELIDNILSIIENNDLKEKLAQNAKQSVKQFQWENIAPLWRALIKPLSS